ADDQAETAGSSRRHASDRVLDDDGSFWPNPESPRRFEEGIRCRLSRQIQSRGIQSVNPDVEQLIETRGLQYLLAIATRRNYRRPETERAQPADQSHGRRINIHAFTAHQRQEQPILALGEAIDGFGLRTVALVAFCHLRPAGCQKAANGVLARTPID